MLNAAYDRISADYDAHWSVHVSEPQARLTEHMRLASGERCADLGCGTGIDTVEMLKRVSPGQVLAVDPSSVMLEAAQRRARAAGLTLQTCCQTAEDFLQTSPDRSFDLISMRFTLGYLDWRSALPELPRLLRSGGRIGVLAILASSAPQAYATYRDMVRDLGLPQVTLTAVPSVDEIVEGLVSRSELVSQVAWQQKLRLTFSSGERLAHFLRDSGIATHPALSALPEQAARLLWRVFAERIEAYREADGIPLDFELGGVVAAAPRASTERDCSEG